MLSLLLLATLPSVIPLPPGLSAKVSRRGRSRLPEVALARGPLSEATTGAGGLTDLYGYPWALVWHYTDGLLLFRHGAQGWTAQASLLPLPVLPANARHISLAFDQAARPVIAWEIDGNVFVRQWDAGSVAFVVRGPFAGADPLLVCDARVLGTVAGSDVVLVHLSQDRLGVLHRIQGELYGTARTMATLSDPVYADQILELPKKLAVRLGTDAGLELELESDPYPFDLRDTALATLTGPSAGVLFDVVIPRVLPLDGVTSSLVGPSAGVLFDVVIPRVLPLEGVTSSLVGPSAGVLFDAVQPYVPTLEGVTATLAGPSGGVLA
jgi:hypothetical protein